MNTCGTCKKQYNPTDEGVTVELDGALLHFCGTCMEETGDLFYCGHCYTTYHNDDEDREFESVCIYCARDAREKRTN